MRILRRLSIAISPLSLTARIGIFFFFFSRLIRLSWIKERGTVAYTGRSSSFSIWAASLMPERIILRNSANNVPRNPPRKIDKIRICNFLGLIGWMGSTAVSTIRTLPISPALAIRSCWYELSKPVYSCCLTSTSRNNCKYWRCSSGKRFNVPSSSAIFLLIAASCAFICCIIGCSSIYLDEASATCCSSWIFCVSKVMLWVKYNSDSLVTSTVFACWRKRLNSRSATSSCCFNSGNWFSRNSSVCAVSADRRSIFCWL